MLASKSSRDFARLVIELTPEPFETGGRGRPRPRSGSANRRSPCRFEPSLPGMEWRETYERRWSGTTWGRARAHDERQLVQLANAAWAAGLCLLMAGDRAGLDRMAPCAPAARYRESWHAGAAPRRVGPADRGDEGAPHCGRRCAPRDAVGARRRRARRRSRRSDATPARLALLVLGRDEEAAVVAASLGSSFPRGRRSGAPRARRRRNGDVYAVAIGDASGGRSRSGTQFLEDTPVPDTKVALDALARRRKLQP